MSPFTLVLAVLAQTVALAAIVWKGGSVIGRLEQTLTTVCSEIEELRDTRDSHIGLLARVVGQLTDLERRVGRLEA